MLLTLSAACLALRGGRAPTLHFGGRFAGPVVAQEAADADYAELDSWLGEAEHVEDVQPQSMAEVRRAAIIQDDPYHVPHDEWNCESLGRPHAHFFHPHGYDELGATPRLLEALGEAGLASPSVCAAAAWAPSLRGDNVVIAHASGAGKTLAFLGPLVERLWALEASDGKAKPAEVRSVILVPTQELAQQALALVTTLAGSSLRAEVVTTAKKWSEQREACASGLDILIATFGRLSTHLKADPPSFDLSGLRSVVIDEADLMYDDREHLANWEWLRPQLPAGCTTSLVTATLRKKQEKLWARDLPSAKLIVDKGLHATRPGVVTRLVDCTAAADVEQRDATFSALLDALARGTEERTLVLVHAIATCDWLAERLVETLEGAEAADDDDGKRARMRVHRLHGSLAPDARREAISSFSAPSPLAQGLRRVLVTTQPSARGLDLPGVKHVALYDFVRDGAEYVRSVGRATRGDDEPARVTLLAHGRALPFAKALIALDSAGKSISLEHQREGRRGR